MFTETDIEFFESTFNESQGRVQGIKHPYAQLMHTPQTLKESLFPAIKHVYRGMKFSFKHLYIFKDSIVDKLSVFLEDKEKEGLNSKFRKRKEIQDFVP